MPQRLKLRIVSSGLAGENLEREVSLPAALLAWKWEVGAAARGLDLQGLGSAEGWLRLGRPCETLCAMQCEEGFLYYNV